MKRSTQFKSNLKDCLAPYLQLQKEFEINIIKEDNGFIENIEYASETDSTFEI